jgi:hypothetical protein
MLTITRKGFFSRDLEVRDGIAPVAEINMSGFRERAELRVGTELYEARRVGWMNAALVLERQGTEVARAEPEGFFRRAYRIRTSRATFTLKPQGFWRPEYVLTDGGMNIGAIQRAGFWRTSMEAAFRPEVDRAVQVFAIWVVAVLFRRAATAAASG